MSRWRVRNGELKENCASGVGCGRRFFIGVIGSDAPLPAVIANEQGPLTQGWEPWQLGCCTRTRPI